MQIEVNTRNRRSTMSVKALTGLTISNLARVIHDNDLGGLLFSLF